jgi:hypothetical protein
MCYNSIKDQILHIGKIPEAMGMTFLAIQTLSCRYSSQRLNAGISVSFKQRSVSLKNEYNLAAVIMCMDSNA